LLVKVFLFFFGFGFIVGERCMKMQL